MATFAFLHNKPKTWDASKFAFVDTEVGLEDHKIHDIGALRYDGATYHGASREKLVRFLETGVVDSLFPQASRRRYSYIPVADYHRLPMGGSQDKDFQKICQESGSPLRQTLPSTL